MPLKLTEQVLKTIRHYEMLRPGETVMAAVSGGPDSVFLLHALYRLRSKLKLSKLSVCNLDHCLRGEESREDSAFVKKVCRELGLECVHKRVDITKEMGRGLSVEEVARQVRYRFFLDAARHAGATVIATGHTLDDQAETILMRFIKGASLKGMMGVTPVRTEKGTRIIRPLLEIEKDAIVRHLDHGEIRYRIDRSNLEPVYFRNIVRKEIVPFLERYNPKLKRSLFNLAEHLRDDFAFLEDARARAKGLLSLQDGFVELLLKDIAVQPKAIQKEIVRDALQQAGGEVKKLSFRHWKEVEQLITRKGRGSAVDLPGDIRISRTERSLVLRKRCDQGRCSLLSRNDFDTIHNVL